MLGRGVDVILAGPTPSHRPAAEATSSVPIVAPTLADPVRDGFVDSLARPGRNLTGLTLIQPFMNAKKLELLKTAVPSAERIVVAWWAGSADPELPSIEATARGLGVQLLPREIRAAEELEHAFGNARQAGADAVILATSAPFTTHLNRIIELLRGSRLPAIAGELDFARAGGLMNYGPNVVENWRRAADLVDRILRGARPADIPIEQPARIDFVVNLRAAEQLQIAIPPTVLAQATETIH
jgi:putative ABC transport system substrate-binding protein